MFDIFELFEEFDTDVIRVSDFGIIADGTLVDYIVKKGNQSKREKKYLKKYLKTFNHGRNYNCRVGEW